MRRRLNLPLLAALVFGSLSFGIAVYFIHGFQVRKNASGLLRRAAVAREEGDLDETVRLMRRYLAHRPDDADQFMQIALDAKANIFAKAAARQTPHRKEIDLAAYLMDEAVRKSPGLKTETDEPDVQRQQQLWREAAEFWFALKNYLAASDNLELIGKDNWEREYSDAEKSAWPAGSPKVAWTNDDDRMLYIECLRLMGSPEEEDKAIQQLQKIVGYDQAKNAFDTESAEMPQVLNAYQSLVVLLVNKRFDRDLAERVIDQMLVANPENAEAELMYSRLIRYIRNQEGKDKSFAAVERAYALDKENVDIVASVAAMYLEQKKYEEAKSLLEDGLQRATELRAKSRLYDLLSQAYISQKDIPGAMAVLERGNVEVPADRELLWKKARLLLDEKKHAEVEKLYKPLERARTDAALIGYLQARILMDKGDHRTATRALESIRPLLSNNPMLQLEIDTYLSVCYGVLGYHDKRMEVVQNLLKFQPDNPKAQEGYIQSLMTLGRNKEAYDYLRSIAQKKQANNEPLSTELQLLATQLRMKVEIGEASEIDQSNVRAIQAQLQQIYNNKDIPETQRMALLIDYFRKMKDPKKAKSYVIKAIQSNREHFPLWALRMDYAETKEEAMQVMGEMKSAVDAEKYALSMRAMEARIAIKFERENAGEVIKQLEQGLDGYSPEEQAGLLYELGSLQLMLGNRNEGVRLLEAASKAAPQRLDILSTLIQDASQQTDADRMDMLVDRIRQITTVDDDTWRLAEANRLIWRIRNGKIAASDKKKALDRAQQLMEVARSNRPQHIPILLLQAEIERERGDATAAIETLTKAHDLQPGNANIIRLIAQSYKNIRNIPMMDAWMKRLPVNMRSSRDNRVELSSLMLRSSGWSDAERAHAIDLVLELVPDESTDAADWGLRSRVYMAAKDMDLATSAAMRAKELDPRSPDVWTNLVNILNQQGKKTEAMEAMQEAEFQLPEATKPIVMGRCYALLGNFNQAQANFATAMQNDPNNAMIKRLYVESLISDNQIAAATPVIDDILRSADATEDKATLAWARRTKARFLARSSGYSDFNKALSLIEQNHSNDSEIAREDLALWVALCFERPEKQSWDRALYKLNQVAKARPLNDDELFMKAQLLEKYDQPATWEEAKTTTIQILARNPGNQKIVESLVKWYLERRELDKARQLASNNLDQTAVTRLRVELHSAANAGRVDQAIGKIQRSTPRDPNTTEQLSTILTLSVIAEELGQYDQKFYLLAEDLLKILARKAPREVLRLATSMGKHGDAAKISLALQYCQQARKQGIPDTMSAGVALAILRQHPEKWDNVLADSVRSTGAWLEKIAAEVPDDTEMQWRLAEFQDMVGQLDAAEVTYKKLLASSNFDNPLNRGMVMNNLAYVMALNGKPEEPMKFVRDAELLLGPTPDLIDTRGYVYLVQGDYTNAVRDFERALETGTGSSQKLFHLALAHEQAGQSDDAQTRWNEALSAGLQKFQLPLPLREKFDVLQLKYGGTPVAMTR